MSFFDAVSTPASALAGLVIFISCTLRAIKKLAPSSRGLDKVRAYLLFISITLTSCALGIVTCISSARDLILPPHGACALSFVLAALFVSLTPRLHVPPNVLEDISSSRVRGARLLFFALCCTISSAATIVLYLSRAVPAPIAGLFAAKDAIAAAGCFLILYCQDAPDVMMRLSRTYFGRIKRERHISRLAHGRVLFSYSVNTTHDRVEDGAEYFLKNSDGAASYSASRERFILECVNPEDAESIRMNSTERFYKNMLRSDPSYSLRFRVSPARLREFVDLSRDGETEMATSEKEWAWLAVNCIVVRDEMSGDTYLFVHVIDVDTDMRNFEDMKQSASVDALTGIFNRKALEGAITNALSKDRANGAMVLIDLDNFKSVNDILGHPAGDKVLCETADIISAEFRSEDIVGRLGGDEFMVFSPGLSKLENITRKIAHLNERGRRDIPTPDGGTIRVSFSIGVSISPEQGRSYNSLYKRADLALYRSKELGKDRYTMFEEWLEED